MNRLFYLLACYLLDDLISIAYLLSFKISFLVEVIFERLFHVDKLAELVEEPLVYLSDAMYLINRNSYTTKSLSSVQSESLSWIVLSSRSSILGEIRQS